MYSYSLKWNSLRFIDGVVSAVAKFTLSFGKLNTLDHSCRANTLLPWALYAPVVVGSLPRSLGCYHLFPLAILELKIHDFSSQNCVAILLKTEPIGKCHLTFGSKFLFVFFLKLMDFHSSLKIESLKQVLLKLEVLLLELLVLLISHFVVVLVILHLQLLAKLSNLLAVV